MIIDQHRAHIRVLYDRFMADAQAHNAPSQGLLFPEMFQLSAADAAIFSELKPRFAELGFDLSDMGRGAVAVQGVPFAPITLTVCGRRSIPSCAPVTMC